MNDVASQIIATAVPKTIPQGDMGAPKANAAEGSGETAPIEANKSKDSAETALSPQLSILARKERAIVQKQQEFQRQQQEFQKEKESLLQRLKSYEEKETLSKQGAIKLLQAHGYSYEDATKEVMTEGGAELAAIDRKYREEIDGLKKSMEEKERLAKEDAEKRQKEEIEKTTESYKRDLRSFIEGKSNDFKLVKLFDAEAELVYETIEAYFDQHKKILSNEEAVGLVEKYFKKLVEDANNALTPAQQAAGEKALEEKAAQKTPTRTLTNELQATVPSTLPAKTEQDRIRRALAALESQK